MRSRKEKQTKYTVNFHSELSTLDHGEICLDLQITVVIPISVRKNGISQEIYVSVYLLFVILNQVKSWCFLFIKNVKQWFNRSFRRRINIWIWSRVRVSWWYNISLSMWCRNMHWLYGSFKETRHSKTSKTFIDKVCFLTKKKSSIFIGFIVSRFIINSKFNK